jgi:hypothetical protein
MRSPEALRPRARTAQHGRVSRGVLRCGERIRTLEDLSCGLAAVIVVGDSTRSLRREEGGVRRPVRQLVWMRVP